jgi:hypothetical protein
VLAERPVKVTEWDVTRAPSDTLEVRLPGEVPKSTREVEGSSVVHVIVAVPPPPGAAASAEMAGPVVSARVLRLPASGERRDERVRDALDRLGRECDRRAVALDAREGARRGARRDHRLQVRRAGRDEIVKDRVLPDQASPWKLELLRPSSQRSIWREETTGRPRASPSYDRIGARMRGAVRVHVRGEAP